MNKDNYDQLIRGMDPDFYRNLKGHIDNDPLYVLSAAAGAINTNQTRVLDCSANSRIVRKILAGNDDSVQQCFLRYVVLHKMAECADGFDSFYLNLLAYYCMYPFDPHHAVVSSALKKVLEIPPEEVPHRDVFVAELPSTLQMLPVFSKFDLPRLYFDAGDIDERGMEKEFKVYLHQLRNLAHRNRQRVINNTLQISLHDDYPEDLYTFEYIPPQELLANYDHYKELNFLDYEFGYDLTRDPEGSLTVLHEPPGMEFRVRYLPSREDQDITSIIFLIIDTVLSDVWGSHLVTADNCLSFVFRTNTMNSFDHKMILSLSAALASSCPALKKVLSDGRLLLSERGHREFSLCVENTAFPIVEGQIPIF